MRPLKIVSMFLTLLTVMVSLAGCGSSQNSADSGTPNVGTLSAQGVAVDPYIVGAVFQEVAADGTILQPQSTPSDANGHFQFPAPLTEGSTIMSRASATGTHNGAPYSGILKRQLSGTDATWVVSPLTTLTAAGMTDQQVLALFSSAGLSGLTAADLTADPLSVLSGATTITAGTNLALLQANMAANAFMQALDNFQVNASTFTDPNHAILWQGVVTAITDVVNSSTFQALANDAAVATSGTPLSPDDFIRTVTNLIQAVSNNVRQDLMNNGGMSSLSAIQNIVDNALATAPAIAHQYYADRVGVPPTLDGAVLYANNCSGCHGTLASSTKAGRSAAQIQAAISGNVGSMGSLTLTTAEIQAISDALAGSTPPPVTADGAALYGTNCAGCHGPLATTTKPGRSAAQIQAAISGNVGNMGFITLTTTEIEAIAAALPAAPTPPATPDGAALYGTNCAGCHGPLATTTKPGRSAAQIQSAISNNIGSMGFINLTTAEIEAIAAALPAVPPPNPGPADGATLYANNCSACHGPLATSTKAGRSAAQISAAIAGNIGTMGSITLTSTEIQAIADALPAGNGGPDYSDCTACHGQPPNGNAAPNEAGAHATHQALAGVGTNCAVCHSGAAHNGVIDINIASAYNSKSGTAGENPNGTATCVNVSCHGGQTTPDWYAGSLNVDTDCKSCHTIGTSQYNSPNSGKHSKSDHSKPACTVCHNTATLATNHFSRLDTTALEGPASATIGGGSTRISSYNASTKTCNGCHGSAKW